MLIGQLKWHYQEEVIEATWSSGVCIGSKISMGHLYWHNQCNAYRSSWSWSDTTSTMTMDATWLVEVASPVQRQWTQIVCWWGITNTLTIDPFDYLNWHHHYNDHESSCSAEVKSPVQALSCSAEVKSLVQALWVQLSQLKWHSSTISMSLVSTKFTPPVQY